MKDSVLGKNQKLRLAIAHAINIEKFLKLFTHNVSLKANSIYPPGVPGYNPSSNLPYYFDLNKAKELLKEAGYPDGKGLPIINFDLRGNSSYHRQIGEFIVQQLAQIGIPCQFHLNSFQKFLDRSRKGELQFWLGGWVLDYPDSENILQLFYSKNFSPGPNYSNYQNAQVDHLFERLRFLHDGPEKFEIMQRIEEIVLRDLPWIMLYYSRNYIVYYSYLKNFRYSDLIYNSYKYIRIAE